MKPFGLVDPSEVDAHTAKTMSERKFTDWVIAEAERNGWLCYHVYEQRHYAKRSSSGFPDIVALRDGVVVVAELKSHKGKVTPAQQYWLDKWIEAGALVYVWRPENMDEIIEVLA